MCEVLFSVHVEWIFEGLTSISYAAPDPPPTLDGTHRGRTPPPPPPPCPVSVPSPPVSPQVKVKVKSRALTELQRIRDPYLSLAASLPAHGVTDTLALRTLCSNPTGIPTEHL